MRNEIINIKTDTVTKRNAHKLANELGLSLSSVLNGLLKEFIKTQAVYFSNQKPEIPSEWLKRELAQAERDHKLGYVSPAFNSVEESLSWLHSPNARYVNGKYANRVRKKIPKKD